MASDLIYAFRVTRLPLLDSDGATLGRIEDIVLAPSYGDDPPSVLGFVASSQRRRIFVNAHRIATLDTEGARLRSAAIDLNHFRKRPGELLVTEDVLDKRVGAEHVNDSRARRKSRERRRSGRSPQLRSAPARAPCVASARCESSTGPR